MTDRLIDDTVNTASVVSGQCGQWVKVTDIIFLYLTADQLWRHVTMPLLPQPRDDWSSRWHDDDDDDDADNDDDDIIRIQSSSAISRRVALCRGFTDKQRPIKRLASVTH